MTLRKFICGIFAFFCHTVAVNAQVLPDFTGLVNELMPTVVNITINPNNPETVSSGSGFIISEDGYIATNKHVIADAAEIRVTTFDEKTYKAEITGIDEKTDLAVIKIATTEKLKPVVFGDSDKIRVGEWIIAIGNPFNLGGTVTKGIVSAKSRDIDSGNYDNFIQTDAAINRGNSGGPMFNMAGEIIGINTAIFSTTGNSMGIGFAIPANLAGWVINQLKTKGEVKRGWLGVKIRPLASDMAKNIGLKAGEGAVVSALTPEAPAQKAGVKVGDVIVALENTKIDNTRNFSRMVSETPMGRKSAIQLYRNKQLVTLYAVIEEMPAAKIADKTDITEDPGSSLIDSLDIFVTETPDGLMITDIARNSDAAAKGLKADDIITKIDNRNIFTIEDIRSYLNEVRFGNGSSVLLQIDSDGTGHSVILEFPKKHD